MLISPSYRDLNRKLHETKPDWGTNGGASWIGPFLKGYDSILDYGCGKGVMRVAVADFRRYDPAIPEYADDPSPADLVVCIAVLEHIETECVEAVLDHIRALARKAVIIKISTHQSVLRMADGSAVHRTVHGADWWAPKLLDRWKLNLAERTPRGFRFVGETKHGNYV